MAPVDPIAYVVSLNMLRRHLTVSQRAIVAGKVREIYDREAKERQKGSGGDKKSTSAKSVVALWPQPISEDAGRSRDKAGAAVGVGGRTVDRATKVLDNAVPEIIKVVEQGRMTVTSAVRITDKRQTGRRAAARIGKTEGHRTKVGRTTRTGAQARIGAAIADQNQWIEFEIPMEH